jgi:hypothetical protein
MSTFNAAIERNRIEGKERAGNNFNNWLVFLSVFGVAATVTWLTMRLLLRPRNKYGAGFEDK